MTNLTLSENIEAQIKHLSLLLKKQEEKKIRIPAQGVLQDFLSEKKRKKKTTFNHYRRTFSMFLQTIHTLKNVKFDYIDEFNLELINSFIAERENYVAINTIRTYTIDLIAFNNWLIEKKHKGGHETIKYSDTIAPSKTLCKEHSSKKLPRDQILNFWNLVMKNQEFENEYTMYLYRAALGMYVFQGMRLNEPREITRESVNLNYRQIDLNPDHNKGGRNDKVYIHINYLPILAKFIEIRDRRNEKSDYLFYYASPKKHLGESTIQRWIYAINKKLKRRYGYTKNITTHGLRHSLGHYMSMDKVNPRQIQKVLRHSSVNVTLSMYNHIDDEAAQQGIDNYSPFQKPNERKLLSMYKASDYDQM